MFSLKRVLYYAAVLGALTSSYLMVFSGRSGPVTAAPTSTTNSYDSPRCPPGDQILLTHGDNPEETASTPAAAWTLYQPETVPRLSIRTSTYIQSALNTSTAQLAYVVGTTPLALVELSRRNALDGTFGWTVIETSTCSSLLVHAPTQEIAAAEGTDG